MLKTVKDACELQDEALNIWVNDQVEQLDQMIHTAGNGEAFFEKKPYYSRDGNPFAGRIGPSGAESG